MLKRLKTDFYLMMITLVGLLAGVTILPYAFYRLVYGDFWVALIDFALVITCALSNWFAWRTGKTDVAGLLIGLTFCGGCLAVIYKLGAEAIFWVYPLMVFLFFLVPPLKALIFLFATLISVLFLHFADITHIFFSQFQLYSFASTTLVTCLFSYIFAYRSNLQRQELRVSASTDPLTGANNRLHLTQELTSALHRFNQKHINSGLMLLDLDHFKQINDTYGHQLGDSILTSLVPILRQQLRQQDQVFRYGGEEFVILVQGIRPEDLHQLANKIRLNVHQHLNLPNGQAITISVGLASAHQAYDWSHWLQLADKALYLAKNQGRNQVMSAQAPHSAPVRNALHLQQSNRTT